jgi:hypothetical protein
VSLGHRLLVHAELGNDALLLGPLPPRDRPSHDVPSLVPTEAEQVGAARDIGLEQHVDGVSLEGDGEPTAGQGPGEVDLSDAVLVTGDPGGSGV